MSEASEALEKAVATLADVDAGWVHRRDAVDELGRVAHRALETLSNHRMDPDVDVAGEVEKVMAPLAEYLGHLKPAPPAPGTREPIPLEVLAKGCEREGHRTVAPSGEGYVVDVIVKSERHQQVFIMPAEGERGAKIVRIFTRCGKPSADHLRWALHTNMKLTHSAIALVTEDGEDHFVLINCYLDWEATPAEVKASVKEIALYGEWIERRLEHPENA